MVSSKLKVLREAGQYIKSQRDNRIIISLPATYFEISHAMYLQSTLDDIVLLHIMGLKIAICFEACQIINNQILPFNQQQEIDETALIEFSKSIGFIRNKLESLLIRSSLAAPSQETMSRVTKTSQGLINVYSGNFIIAKPKGIIEGTDFGFSGNIRKINKDPILAALDQNSIVLISPIGHSPSGESFILNYLNTALGCASLINANKLIYLTDTPISDNIKTRELTVAETRALMESKIIDPSLQIIMHSAASACQRGIDRCYILDFKMEGALILELLTRDGVGIMITEDDYDVFRHAHSDDIPRLVALIEPLENEGILVKRSRELLEKEIQNFWVMLRDGLIIGCGAIYPYEEESMGEIACLTMHPDYRNNGRADKLLVTLEKEAIKKGLTTVFALTTHTAHWFIEHGFARANIEDLPILKQTLYNHQRRSLVFIKKLINNN